MTQYWSEEITVVGECFVPMQVNFVSFEYPQEILSMTVTVIRMIFMQDDHGNYNINGDNHNDDDDNINEHKAIQEDKL